MKRYMLPFTTWAGKTHCAGCGYSGDGDCFCRDAPEAGTGRELGPDAEWGGDIGRAGDGTPTTDYSRGEK